MSQSKFDARQYLDIQYPIIKSEVAQANSSLGIILTYIWGLMAIIVSIILSVWFSVDWNFVFITCWSVVSGILGVVSLLLFAKSVKIFRELVPNINRKKIEPITLVSSEYSGMLAEKRYEKLNITYFATFGYVSKDEFLTFFDHETDDKLTILMLEQAYINGRIAYKKYKTALKSPHFFKL